ncbi:hypothetical protein ACIRPK_34095 [Kitasatospora sp. NPDC101801]|uniref:hypothetical protein n=1 Tax=Kitasatospora sp. NPDC101801 TaxID=3364103 RepID=UPI0037FC53C7
MTSTNETGRQSIAANADTQADWLVGGVMDFWAVSARAHLRAYLLAAELEGASTETMRRWAANPASPEPLEILRRHPDQAPASWLTVLEDAASPGGLPDTYHQGLQAVMLAAVDQVILAEADRERYEARQAELAAMVDRYEAADQVEYSQWAFGQDMDTAMRKAALFDAPSAADAYGRAAELEPEVTFLQSERQSYEQMLARGEMEQVPPHNERELLLREAAAADRTYWADLLAEDLTAAALAAFRLAQFDQAHGQFVAGPHQPDSIEFDPEGGQRAYVRQEFKAWLERKR